MSNDSTTDKKDDYNSVIEKAVQHGRDMFDLGIDAAIEVIKNEMEEHLPITTGLISATLEKIISRLEQLKNKKG